MRIMPNDELCRVDRTSHVKDKRIYPAIRHNQKGFDRSRFGNCQGVWCQKFWKSCHCLGLQDLGLVACRSGSGGCQGFEERTLMRFI
jgi:hypothetical protein